MIKAKYTSELAENEKDAVSIEWTLTRDGWRHLMACLKVGSQNVPEGTTVRGGLMQHYKEIKAALKKKNEGNS